MTIFDWDDSCSCTLWRQICSVDGTALSNLAYTARNCALAFAVLQWIQFAVDICELVVIRFMHRPQEGVMKILRLDIELELRRNAEESKPSARWVIPGTLGTAEYNRPTGKRA
jgi:hypothetical protein